MCEKVRRIGSRCKGKGISRISSRDALEGRFRLPNGELWESRHLLISLLVPTAVQEFFRQLEEEVTRLCGRRHEQDKGEHCRWGSQGGSIYLGGQKIGIRKPRVRNRKDKEEVALEMYESFQNSSLFEEKVFGEALRKVSQRDYERGVPQIAESFGFKKSTVSQHFKKASQKQLDALLQRRFNDLSLAAVIIDGKRFRSHGVVIALGVGEDGRKHVLGIFESSTENRAACLELLNNLERRGLPEEGLLFIVDGGAGLNAALDEKYETHAPEKRKGVRVRCHFHKWNNISDALGSDHKEHETAHALFWNMRSAPSLADAQQCAAELERLLKKANISALASFLEAKDDLLVLHQIGLTTPLKRFFSTTNAIESLNSLIEEDLRRVKRWRDSMHFQRWLATALLRSEKRMRRIRGFKHLSGIRSRVLELCKEKTLDKGIDDLKKAA